MAYHRDMPKLEQYHNEHVDTTDVNLSLQSSCRSDQRGSRT